MAPLPVLTVAHQRQALITAKQDDRVYGSLRDCLRGMVFLGTPHRGSSLAILGGILARIVNLVAARFGRLARTALIDYLRPDSKALSDLIERSCKQLDGLKIVSCVEQKPTLLFDENRVCTSQCQGSSTADGW